MKKMLYSLLLGALLLFSSGRANAQKALHLNSEERLNSIAVSQEQRIEPFGDNGTIVYRQPAAKREAGNIHHTLKITVAGDWQRLFIANEDGFMQTVSKRAEDTYSIEVPEGFCDIIVTGRTTAGANAYLAFEQIPVQKDTILRFSMKDATNKVGVQFLNQNSVSFAGLSGINLKLYYFIDMHCAIGATIFYDEVIDNQMLDEHCLYFNDFGNRYSLQALINAYADGVHYVVETNAITEGLSGNFILNNTGKKLAYMEEAFPCLNETPPSSSYSDAGIVTVFSDPAGNLTLSNIHQYVSFHRTFDTKESYKLYTNVSAPEEKQCTNFRIACPIVLISYDFEAPDLKDIVTTSSVVIYKDSILRNFLPQLYDFSLLRHESRLHDFINNQTSNRYESGHLFTYNSRTPHLYFQPQCFGKATRSEEATEMRFYLLYIGENNEQRYYDSDVSASIKVNNQDVFNDSIHLLQHTFIELEPGVVNISLKNDKYVAYGQPLFNETEIELDLSREDALPPIVTTLRVVDKNNEEQIFIKDKQHAQIVFTAADFFSDLEKGSMIYLQEANIELEYTIDGISFLPLLYSEEKEKFNTTYGHFYTAKLSQLPDLPEKYWITIVLTLTDEAGNRQRQTLGSLFHVSTNDVSIVQNRQELHKIYPNPFSRTVTIALEQPLNGETYFEIYTIDGKIIHQEKLQCQQQDSFTWNAGNQAPGIYLFGIYNGNNSLKGKLIKQH